MQYIDGAGLDTISLNEARWIYLFNSSPNREELIFSKSCPLKSFIPITALIKPGFTLLSISETLPLLRYKIHCTTNIQSLKISDCNCFNTTAVCLVLGSRKSPLTLSHLSIKTIRFHSRIHNYESLYPHFKGLVPNKFLNVISEFQDFAWVLPSTKSYDLFLL